MRHSPIEGEDPAERNPDPPGTVVQLVQHLVERLVQETSVEERSEILQIAGQKRSWNGRVAIGAEEDRRRGLLPEARPGLESVERFRAATRELQQARPGGVTELT